MREFEIIVRGLYGPEQVQADYQPVLRLPETPAMRQWMEAEWQARLKEAREKKILLFDAPLLRLIQAQACSDGTLQLRLGTTSYKEYVTTRTADFVAKHVRQDLSNPLAVCSVIETSDGYILLDKREGVDGYTGRYHVIGGFCERDQDIHQESRQPDLFGAIRREIREETGIQPVDIAQQYCLGVVYDLALPHSELCFLTQLHISLEEVTQQRCPEDQEVRHLETLLVTAQSLRSFIVSHHGNISPTGEPDLLFYGAWKFGEAWFEDVLSCL